VQNIYTIVIERGGQQKGEKHSLRREKPQETGRHSTHRPDRGSHLCLWLRSCWAPEESLLCQPHLGRNHRAAILESSIPGTLKTWAVQAPTSEVRPSYGGWRTRGATSVNGRDRSTARILAGLPGLEQDRWSGPPERMSPVPLRHLVRQNCRRTLNEGAPRGQSGTRSEGVLWLKKAVRKNAQSCEKEGLH